MDIPENANENRTSWNVADPDIPYIKEYLDKTLAHFGECGFHPHTVSTLLTEAIIKIAPGKPYDKVPDEGDIRAGLSILVGSAYMLDIRVQAHQRAQNRLHQQRIEKLAGEHGCSVEEALKIWVAKHNEAAPSDPS